MKLVATLLVRLNFRRTFKGSGIPTCCRIFCIQSDFRRWIRLVVALWFVVGAFGSSVNAQEHRATTPLGGPLEIKVIGDRILARIELQTEVWFKDTHIVIDFDSPRPMQVQPPLIEGIRFGEGEETLKILQRDFRLEVPRIGIVPEEGSTTGDITGLYDNELDQIDVFAIVGWPIWEPFALSLDIQEKELRLSPAETIDQEVVRNNSEVFVDGVEVVRDSVFVPVNYGDGQSAFMKFRTGAYHTTVDEQLLEKEGIDDPRNSEIYFGSEPTMKISDMAALYPRDIMADWQQTYESAKAIESQVQAQVDNANAVFPEIYRAYLDLPSGPVLGETGLSLLSGYRIDLNAKFGYIGVTRTTNSNFSEADHVFYTAAATKSSDLLYEYLQGNPTDRNVIEAVTMLFQMGLEEDASIDHQLEVVEFGVNWHKERRRFLYLAEFTLPLFGNPETKEKHSDLVIALGEKALEFVGRSQTPRFRQQVQMAVGDRYLARGDAETAWKYFLSSAFNGDPRMDGIARYDLGRAYEAQGRVRRAYSSYGRAIPGLPPDMQEQAKEALKRLATQMSSDDELLKEYPFDG